MFSKKPRSQIGMLLLFLLLSSCTDFLRGPKHAAESLDIPSGQLSCLKKIPDNFSKMGQGEALGAEVDTDFKCLEAALLYFKDRTVGTYKEAYTGEDFRKFFGKYFLIKNNISTDFASQLLTLKAAVVGGKVDLVTKDEVAKLSQFIGVLREQLIPILPSLKVLLQKSKTADQFQIKSAIAAVKASGQILLKESMLYKSDYTFENLHSLVLETGSFIGIQSDNKVSYDFKKLWPLFNSAKTLLLGEHAVLRNLDEWTGALNTFADLYELVLKKHYLMQGFKFENSADLYLLSEAGEQFLELLKNSQQIKNGPGIDVKDIDELIDQLIRAKMLNTEIKASTLKDAYRTLLGRMALGVQFKTASDVNHVTQEHIYYFKRLVRIWRHLQVWIDTLTKDPKKPLSFELIAESLKGFKSMSLESSPVVATDEKLTDSERLEIQTAVTEFQSLLSLKQPVKFNLKGRFMIQYDNSKGGVSWNSLSLSNITYIISRIMIQGYGEHRAESNKIVVTGSELARWYGDFKNLGSELKAFDPRSGNSGRRSAKEANFFMFSSNGDADVDSSELYEYISTMAGAGLNSVSSFRELAGKENCIETGTRDIFGLPFVNEKCFKSAVEKNRAEIFDNLPSLIVYFQKYPQQWSLFYDRLINAARVSDPKDGRLDHGDLRVFIMMLHYEEALMLTFDHNKDGVLSIPEVESAVPRFLGFLREMATEMPWYAKPAEATFLKNGFIYLVMEGHQPVGSDWLGYLWDRTMDPLFGSEATADRAGVAQVFRNLKDELKKP